ncbi:MAG: leucine-rich repeat domain-containing protein [Clostridiales bacterium]|nr:leucine-rich repeat domain-containing protein [Clostridiales bacterium]
MKKRVWFLFLFLGLLSLAFSLAACDLLGDIIGGGGSGEAPTFKSMTISSSPSGGDDTFIYAEPYSAVYVKIKLDNPDDCVIANVTINDKTYEAASFESGSNRETIVIKVNVSSDTGTVEFKLESVKYVDGKVLKDVALSGEQIVRVGVRTDSQVDATVTAKVGFTDVTFNVTVSDDDGLIAFSNGNVKIEVHHDDTLIASKSLVVGDNSVRFDGLEIGQWYWYNVLATYDDLQEGNREYLLANDLFKTNEVVSFVNVTETYDGVEFDLKWHEDAVDKTVKELHLLDGDSDVKLDNATATDVSGLLSGRDYTVVVYFDYNGQTYNIRRSFHTLTKHAPTFAVSNLWVAEDEIRFDVVIDDPDHAGTLITTLDGQNVSALTGNQKQISFNNLSYGQTYEIEISYNYNLNDGEGKHPLGEIYTVTVDSQTIHQTSCKLGYRVLDHVTCVATKNSKCTHSELAIPSTIDGYTVARIDNFSNNSYVTSLILPDTVAQFVSSAFANCKNLTSVTLPQNLSVLGEKMFSGCEALSHVTIPTAVTAIPNEAFYGCQALTSISIPSNVVSIGNKAFRGTGLQTLTLATDSNLTTIGDEAFYELSQITELTLPEGLVNIGNGAFYGLNQLTALTIPASVMRIYSDAFSNCTRLQNLTFAEDSKLYSIGASAFYRCADLSQLLLPSELYSIGDNAFCGCSFTSITIPSGVVSIGNSAFASSIINGGLQEVIFEANSALMTIGSGAFSNTALAKVTIPRSVRTIGAKAFYRCRSLTKVEFEQNSNLQTIGNSAFAESANFSLIRIPARVVSIGDSAFENCTAMVMFDDGSQLSTIGSRAFYGCRGISSFILPVSVTSIGSYAFSGCKNLTTITIPRSVVTIGERAFFDSAVRNVTIEDDSNLTTIGAYAFAECALSTITIPRCVATIGEGAFQGCVSVTEVVIPASVTTIGEGAFKNCSGLKTFTFNEGSQLTTIGANFFEGCVAIAEFTIPASVTSIGEGAFRNLVNLRSVTFEESSRLQIIGRRAFEGCISLSNIILPEGLTEIYGSVFYGCTGLQWVVIPATITYIGGYAIDYNNSTKIYFSGSYEQWSKVSFADSSDRNHFQDKCEDVYFRTYPQGKPSWRYDDNGNPKPNA